jgi:hypothetical protein
MCEFEFHSWRGVLDTTLCDTDCKLLVAGRGFSPGTDFRLGVTQQNLIPLLDINAKIQGRYHRQCKNTKKGEDTFQELVLHKTSQ